jgi:hypothetical protein
VKREKRMIGCRVSFPAPFYDELEGLWMYESGAHHAIKFEQFLSTLVGYGLECYRKTLPLWKEEDPPAKDEGPDPADDEAWEFPRNNRRPLLRFGGEQ